MRTCSACSGRAGGHDMIIVRSRKLASENPGAFLRHVFHGKDNERIQVFKGTEADVLDMVSDARAWRRDFAYRHFIVAPKEMPAEGMFADAVAELAREFGFDPTRAVAVGHQKPRHGLDGAPYHMHLLVPEVHPATGRVLDSSWDYARHEKVCRRLEARWGHAIVPGRWNKAVMTALRAEGAAEADILEAEGLAAMAKAQARYPKGLDRELERKAGRRLPEVAGAVLDARVLSGGDAAGFLRLLVEQGLRVVPGDKAGRWAVEARDEGGAWHFAGALNRLAKMKVGEADGWMLGPGGPAMDQGEDGYEQGGTAMEVDGLRGGEEGHARPGRPPRGRSERDADGLRGGAGFGDNGGSADGAARPGRGRGRRERARPHRGPADGAGAAAAGAGGEDGRTRALALLARPAGRGHAPGRRGRGGDRRVAPVAAALARSDAEASAATASLRASAAPASTPTRLRALDGIRATAALQWRFGSPQAIIRLEREAAMVLPSLKPLPGEHNRTMGVDEGDAARRRRRAAFLAVLLRRAYVLDWMPAAALLHLSRVDIDAGTGSVLITLTNGARILDTGDRITLRGEVEELGVAELAECARRRGWKSAVLTGNEEFRLAAARALLRRGIAVVDCPLPLDEQHALLALGSARTRLGRGAEVLSGAVAPVAGVTSGPPVAVAA